MPCRVHMLIAGAAAALVLNACSDDTATTTTAPPPASTTTQAAAPTTTNTTTLATTTTGLATPSTTPHETTVDGVVIDVVGGLSGIDAFTLRLADGSDLELVPADGVLFDGVAPISHLQDHLVSGAPVRVTFLVVSIGPLVVTSIGDAGGGHNDD